jgi:hypothetical protein
MSKRVHHVVHLVCVDKATVEVPFTTAEGAAAFEAWVGPFTGGHYRVTGRSERPAVYVPAVTDVTMDLIVKVGEAAAVGHGAEAAEQAASVHARVRKGDCQ